MEGKISVVVPVYNVEKYLRQCLDSIVNQTYKDLEIILVDDGSPDNCGAICDEYAAKDPRITVIHKANEGLSAARNDGIEQTTGDWIAFVDSDDWCEPDYYERLLASAKDQSPDVIFAGGYYKAYSSKSKEIHVFDKLRIFEGHEQIENLQADIVRCGLPWDKLYKASFLREFRFARDIRAFEDFLFNFQVLGKAQRVTVIPVIGYHYRQVDASIANRYNPEKPNINYKFVSRLQDCAKAQGITAKLHDGIHAATICAISVAMNCCHFHPENPKKRNEVYQEVSKMIQLPYCREAIDSRSNRYLSGKQTVLKYALRLKKHPSVLRMLYAAKKNLKP